MKAMKTDSKQMRFCSSSIFCTERNSATTKQIAGKTGKSVSQGGTDHVGIFPSDCTPISVSTAHSAQRNTGRVNRECQVQVGVLIMLLVYSILVIMTSLFYIKIVDIPFGFWSANRNWNSQTATLWMKADGPSPIHQDAKLCGHQHAATVQRKDSPWGMTT